MGTHKEGGATSFWSYTLNLPLSSNALVSWKFCYLLHKVLRGGHRNARLNLRVTRWLPFSVSALILAFLPLLCRLFQIHTDTVPPSKIWVLSG